MKKISKNLYQLANSCVEFRKNSRFSSIFFKIHNFGTHIFLYVYTTHTQLPHMSYSGFQIHNTCYTHVKSCVYMCCVQDSTLIISKNLKNRVLEHILPCVIRISSSAVIFTIKTYFWKGLRSSKIIQLEQALSGDFRELSLAVFGLLEAKIGLTRPVQPLVLTYGNWEKSIKI